MSDRNQRVRRADWRYLLPDAAPARALCTAGDDLLAACEIVARDVHRVAQPGVLYDLVVAEDPDASALVALAAVLHPEGACYVEWSRSGPGAPRRLRQRVELAGFSGAVAYRPWPSLAECRAWVPTEGAAAEHHWRLAPRSTPVLKERARHVAGATLARLGVHARIAVVAHGPAAAREPMLVRLAREHGALPASVSVTTTGRDAMLITSGERIVGKVVLLAFDANGAPAIAIKTSRTSESASGVSREADVLDAVAALHPSGMPGVPRVLFRDEALGQPVVGQSALTGTPLAAELRTSRYEGIARDVEEWLTVLAQPSLATPADDSWGRLVGPALARFETEFGEVLDADRRLRTREALLGIGPLAPVCEQRDFSPWNVFRGESGLVVLDWESSEPAGLPALDLIYFCTHAAYYTEGAWTSGHFEEAYRAAWSRETDIGRVNLACAGRYLRRLGLSDDALHPLRLCAWVIHAHSDYVHLCADAGGVPSADQLRTSRFLRLYDVELTEGMR